MAGKKEVLVVCGPTAAGKSALVDDLADGLSAARGERAPVAVVDSMQVYEGLAEITNQARRRPAELVGFVPVSERWTVARHREAADAVISGHETAVLDAGTGMYLNAVLLDLPLAPEVPKEVRRRAEEASAGEANPRRASRELELSMVGAAERGSVWDGSLRFATTLVYLRPERHRLDAAISRRTARIIRHGKDEAVALRDRLELGEPVNPSVLESVGVKELLGLVSGPMTLDEAAERVETRTRRLARRQMRWFDKLARTLEGRARVLFTEDPSHERLVHIMHGRM